MELCELCLNYSKLDDICYSCNPVKIYNNKPYRLKRFYKIILQLIPDSNRFRIRELFVFFNDYYKGKALHYKFFIKQIADLLNIDNTIEVRGSKRDKEIWNEFLLTDPLKKVENQREFRENILKQC